MIYWSAFVVGISLSLAVQAAGVDANGRPLPESASQPAVTAQPSANPEPRLQQAVPKSSTSQNPDRLLNTVRLLDEDCIDDRQIMLSHDTRLLPQEWFLKTQEAMIRLTATMTMPGQVTLTIPETLERHSYQAYSLYFKVLNEPGLSHTGQAIYFCHRQTDITPRRHGEILILLSQSRLDSVVSKLKKQGFIVADKTALMADQHLLTIRGPSDDWAQTQLEILRKAFPDLIIDFNDYYPPAESVRIYARELMSWPDIGCLPHAKSAVKIGIIDGLLDSEHPLLRARPVSTERFVSSPSAETDHATNIAVLLAGNDKAERLTGLISTAELYSAAVVETSEYGDMASVSAIIRALHWLNQRQVRLINLSLAGKESNLVLATALQYAKREGMLVFVAAGNHGLDQPAYPAAYDSVLAVTAVDSAGRLYALANRGEHIDFAAPGVDIWTASGGYRSGTSYAVPHAVAITALLLQLNPTLSVDLVYESLRRSSKDLGVTGFDKAFGWGLLQYPHQLCQ